MLKCLKIIAAPFLDTSSASNSPLYFTNMQKLLLHPNCRLTFDNGNVLDDIVEESGQAWTRVCVCINGAALETGTISSQCMSKCVALAPTRMSEWIADRFSACMKMVNFNKEPLLDLRLIENTASKYKLNPSIFLLQQK
ncbi:hypothetical protein RF11_13166 [Thelohanellus kitauei]|uniref:Uncharacterized protein n=1 Tax=Thelohanellus kitauei TaxID=669202 RepID=A0A0C2J769_THEKT|nr:hypothetical protein RF11_13166 [Thelohanellus kitauei]